MRKLSNALIMRLRPSKMEAKRLLISTKIAKCRILSTLALAHKIAHDVEREKRLETHKCLSCFYCTKKGEVKIFSKPCMNCHIDVLYGSTVIDNLCVDCARELGLFKQCGGDYTLIAIVPTGRNPGFHNYDFILWLYF